MMRKIMLGTVLCLLFVALVGISQSTDTIINMMVDLDTPVSPTETQLLKSRDSFVPILNTMNAEPRNLSWTLFQVQDSSEGNRLFFANIGLNPLIELAISGNQSGEKLSAYTYEEQKSILENSKKWTEACKICGVNEIVAKGFLPQSFDQNEDTYRMLDKLGIEYNAGFQAGVIYEPGHENDVWPYKVDDHNFYAVPISSVTLSGEKVPLIDREMKKRGLSSSEWYDLLVSKLDEVSGKDEPMVFMLSTSLSGSGDYNDAFVKFIDYAESAGAKFVTTNELVGMAQSENRDAPISVEQAESESRCETCDSSSSAQIKVNITIPTTNSTQS